MPWDKIGIAVFTSILTWAITEIRHARSERKKSISEIIERYVADTRSAGFRDTPAERMFAMQRAGVGHFKDEDEVAAFFRGVVARGCTFPLMDGDWHPVITQKNLPGILLEASAYGHQLTSDSALYQFFIERIFAAQKKKAEKEAEYRRSPPIV